MDRYTKAFVVASLCYFVAAAATGIWMGGGSAPEWAWFGHVHFNLLGFMAMMIYGVGYFILPRFNARPLVWPGGVGVHFYIANIGLIGMVATYPERPSTGFVLFSLLALLSAAMFAGNLGATMILPLRVEEGETEAPVTEKAPPAPRITAETRMGEIISRWPQTVDVLVANGFAPLASPAHQEKVKQLPVTLEMACGNHGVDLEKMIGLLNDAMTGPGKAPAGAPIIKSDDVIGEVLKEYPATEEVFRKYYGAACFSCPGQATETIRQSAMMHNADEKQLLRELNDAAR
jgi:hybrid cluster-associated redox disulfide protein